ncbi:non-ribosomal peptide synthetase module [Microaerobacter geothermalis]|uniref:non-ribosomal peptide synthetase module n=1 Tax=Microaerobacter geothermalis TaxID=674972 RepID=UPI001F47EC12|nr:non-ribosomal peptide synthetase module [Microaerobacter geothermalis]MCF6094873.1 non-ribosomal peptide synthetase module [Microaerobacter geothermalis]
MARRLATEYTKVYLELSELEFHQFIQMFTMENFRMEIKILDNGDRELILYETNHQVTLSFVKQENQYICYGSYLIRDLELASLMRKAISTFKGSATVHRIYSNFTMIYQYHNGIVVSIKELNKERERIIYQYKDSLGEFERLYRSQWAEQEIYKIRMKINELLDKRNRHKDHVEMRNQIDQSLKELSNSLFILEA